MPLSLLASIGFKPAPHPSLHLTQPYGSRNHPLILPTVGVRMPRRSLFYPKNIGWWERLKTNLTDRHTWLSLLYFLLQMPLGVLYFSLVVTLFTLSIALMAAPLVQSIADFPLLSVGVTRIYLAPWMAPLFLLAGFLIWTITMHLGKWIGHLHGRYAKTFLVTE